MSNVKERVAKIQENFSYIQIASLNNDVDIGYKNIKSEIWHCGKNGSSYYAFDICIMPMGIAVCGDIGELTFNVYDRGIDFLAGKDVGYYIHSKLSHHCRETQFCEKSFYRHVMDWIFSSFEYKSFMSDEKYEEFEKLVGKENFADFFEKCKRMYFDCDVSNEEHDYLSDLNDFIEKVEEVADNRSAHELLYNTDFLSFDDSLECNFTEMDEGLWFRLNMINHAAKEILKIKENKLVHKDMLNE